MKMQKVIAIGLVAILALSLEACGNNNTPSADSSQEDVDTASSNAAAESVEESVETSSETGSGEELVEDTDTSTEDYGETYPRPNADKVMGDDASAESTYAPTEEILNAAPSDLKIQIGNTIYTPGSSIKDLFYGDWKVYMPTTGETAEPDMRIDPGEKILLEFSRGSESFEGRLAVENSTDETISLEECTVASDFTAPVDFDATYEEKIGFSGVTDEYYRANNDEYVWLPGGISYKCTMDEVEEILGEPYAYKESHTSSSDTKIHVGYLFPTEDGQNICYVFTFPDEKGAYIVNASIGFEKGNEFWTY